MNPTERPSRVRLGVIAFIEPEDPSEADVATEVIASGGTVVQTVGKLVLAWFDTASDSFDCCEKLRAARCRVGISAGDVLLENGLVHGLPVIEAARLKDIAKRDQILCTARVAGLAGLTSHASIPLGEVELKGIDHRVAIVMLR